MSMPYEETLKIKERQVHRLLEPVLAKQETECRIEPIKASPVCYGYRNKMEFTFGERVKDGPLALGMHKKGSFYDIVTVDSYQALWMRITAGYWRRPFLILKKNALLPSLYP